MFGSGGHFPAVAKVQRNIGEAADEARDTQRASDSKDD